MSQARVIELGQVFTPPAVVSFMLGLCRNRGRALEPSAGDGAFWAAMPALFAESVGIEVDAQVAPPGVRVMNFFDLPETETFDTVIGNPPYVRFQDIPPETRAKLDSPLFDQRSNLFLFFIEKAIRHLRPGGELVFIVPRELTKLTAACKLNHWLFSQGSITDFVETGDSRVFGEHTPNCAIFRFEKGRMNHQMNDGRVFAESEGQLLFLRQVYPVLLDALFEVRVGAVSGADTIFRHPEGNREFVCSRTAETGETRRMFYDLRHPFLEGHKETLLVRRVAHFDESNWWQWGRRYPLNDFPRIYVNGRTRRPRPFFLHPCKHFDGSVLALFARDRSMPRKALENCVGLLNEAVDWEELGFVCDGRFLFTQRTLQTCRLPEVFSRFLPCKEC